MFLKFDPKDARADISAKQAFSIMGCRRFARRSAIAYVDALPAATLTYSTGGEDMALMKRLKPRVKSRDPSFYVDIGCGHPHEISNTFIFYTMGWRGLCIDANAEHGDAWRAHRPEDVFLSVAVGEREGTSQLFKSSGENWGVARIGDTQVAGMQTGVPVEMRRLDSLLAEYVGEGEIALMCIDVEFSELAVLSSNDWSRWRPEVLFVEIVGFDFAAPLASPSVKFILDRGYTLLDKIGDNLLFMR